MLSYSNYFVLEIFLSNLFFVFEKILNYLCLSATNISVFMICILILKFLIIRNFMYLPYFILFQLHSFLFLFFKYINFVICLPFEYRYLVFSVAKKGHHFFTLFICLLAVFVLFGIRQNICSFLHTFCFNS